METLLKSIQTKLSTVTGINHIDEDWGQMDFNTPAVKYPAVLVDVQSADYTNDGDLAQQGTVTIAVRCFILKQGGTSTNAPDKHKERNQSYWSLLKEINTKLHGFIPTADTDELPGKLIRSRMTKRITDGGLIRFELLYTMAVTDTSCTQKLDKTPRPTIKIITHTTE